MAKLMAVSETDPGVAVIVTRDLMFWRNECTECGRLEAPEWDEGIEMILKAAQFHIDEIHG